MIESKIYSIQRSGFRPSRPSAGTRVGRWEIDAVNDSGKGRTMTSLATASMAAPSMAMPRRVTRLRITRRGRAVLASLAVFPTLVIALLIGMASGGATAGDQEAAPATVSFEYITVLPGQSLWQVAEEHAPDTDPRDYVNAIMQLNQLPSADIVPGQRIALPQ